MNRLLEALPNWPDIPQAPATPLARSSKCHFEDVTTEHAEEKPKQPNFGIIYGISSFLDFPARLSIPEEKPKEIIDALSKESTAVQKNTMDGVITKAQKRRIRGDHSLVAAATYAISTSRNMNMRGFAEATMPSTHPSKGSAADLNQRSPMIHSCAAAPPSPPIEMDEKGES